MSLARYCSGRGVLTCGGWPLSHSALGLWKVFGALAVAGICCSASCLFGRVLADDNETVKRTE